MVFNVDDPLNYTGVLFDDDPIDPDVWWTAMTWRVLLFDSIPSRPENSYSQATKGLLSRWPNIVYCRKWPSKRRIWLQQYWPDHLVIIIDPSNDDRRYDGQVTDSGQTWPTCWHKATIVVLLSWLPRCLMSIRLSWYVGVLGSDVFGNDPNDPPRVYELTTVTTDAATRWNEMRSDPSVLQAFGKTRHY